MRRSKNKSDACDFYIIPTTFPASDISSDISSRRYRPDDIELLKLFPSQRDDARTNNIRTKAFRQKPSLKLSFETISVTDYIVLERYRYFYGRYRRRKMIVLCYL